ncbi:NAD-dependent epimerase/dehydratase family protein [Alkalihalophilus sp. As8PL]|uniref:NAD-dependent epimerase/dehydratase family protein n=1 Tax=Alkalihalophilus sp. As8PL TaxID=3237103 RepID=A0AB39BQJ4_9BACI
MKVLVTGGSGFIGMNLVEAYLKKGHDVVIVDIHPPLGHLLEHKRVTFYQVDITDQAFFKVVEKEKPDVINHHAAQIDVQRSIKEPAFDANVNILGTINILEACRMNKGATLIYPSSAAVYGTPVYLGIDEDHPVAPISTYGISKYTPEQYIRAYHELYQIPYTIFRYSNVYGKYQDPKGEGGVISILVNCALSERGFCVFGNGEQTRDFIHVSDVVEANMRASEETFNDFFNISTGVATTLNDTITAFEEVIGRTLQKEMVDERAGDIKHSYLLNEKAQRKMGWIPKETVQSGLKQTFEFYNQ